MIFVAAHRVVRIISQTLHPRLFSWIGVPGRNTARAWHNLVVNPSDALRTLFGSITAQSLVFPHVAAQVPLALSIAAPAAVA